MIHKLRQCTLYVVSTYLGVVSVYLSATPVWSIGLSGHHYSWLEGAAIGHDFGRNPWSRNGTEGFAGARGRGNLRQALARAVEAGETAMSFDFAFDLRSVVAFARDGSVALDLFSLSAIKAFLEEVEVADQMARSRGRIFRAEVVLFDFRVADGEVVDDRVLGEYPQFFTNVAERSALFDVLKPALQLLAGHPFIYLNLMNEPEFLALPVVKAIARIETGEWADIAFVDMSGAGKVVAVHGLAAVPLLAALGSHATVRVVGSGRKRADKLVRSSLSVAEIDSFLLELRAAIEEVVPDAQVMIGWADDRSALENTLRLEERAGGLVTEVISFHVYQVPINPWHPLKLSRADFTAAGLGEREIRIGEWGLGVLQGADEIRTAMVAAFDQVGAAGLDGVLFWWDADHIFDHGAYRQAVLSSRERLETLVAGTSSVQQAVELKASFPNPFNGRVVIPYEISVEGSVTLRIYNALGQRVRDVFSGYRDAGRYRATWDGRDDAGKEIASGVYLWELRGGGEVVRRMVTLIR